MERISHNSKVITDSLQLTLIADEKKYKKHKNGTKPKLIDFSNCFVPHEIPSERFQTMLDLYSDACGVIGLINCRGLYCVEEIESLHKQQNQNGEEDRTRNNISD